MLSFTTAIDQSESQTQVCHVRIVLLKLLLCTNISMYLIVNLLTSTDNGRYTVNCFMTLLILSLYSIFVQKNIRATLKCFFLFVDIVTK